MSLSRTKNGIYAERRQQLLSHLEPDALFIVPAAPNAFRNGDSNYFYRPSSSLFYLTGFEEVDSILVLAPNRKEGEFILFNLPKDLNEELWTGKRAGQEGARNQFCADESFSIYEFFTQLPTLLKNRKTIYYPATDKHANHDVIKIIEDAIQKHDAQLKIEDSYDLITIMRSIKDAEEIKLMQKAADISVSAHLKAMQKCKPGMYEYQLEAVLMKMFYSQGSHSPAYPNIVAAGENSCTLHYEKNASMIKEGDLVLIDAAAEFENYAADVTRTFPANGTFSDLQRTAYEVVLKTQLAGIDMIKPGVKWSEIHKRTDIVITQGLLDLGLLTGNLDELVQSRAYRPFYMHGLGHWVGLDTHDVGDYLHDDGSEEIFQPGMLLTIEPGLYIDRERTPNIPAHWPNMGIRIEDVILVTTTGHRVLTEALPKTVAAIEMTMAQAKQAQWMRLHSPKVLPAEQNEATSTHKGSPWATPHV